MRKFPLTFWVAALSVASLCANPAEARRDAPLTGLPLLYDANDKLIGPYILGSALMRIDGRFVGLPSGVTGVNETQFRLYYTSTSCVGDAWIASGTLPIGSVNKGVLYFPEDQRSEVQIRSSRNFTTDGNRNPCEDNFNFSGTFSLAIKKKIDSLKLTPPFRLEAQPLDN